MIREKLAANPRESFFQRLVLAELSAWQLLALAAAIGVLWAASLFDWSFVVGRHAWWQSPKGAIGAGSLDMAQTLVGYYYYAQSPWHLPLFYVSALGVPGGINIMNMNSVQVVALFGKLIHSLTGATINPYGAYVFLSFALPGVMMALVLIAAGVRCALATIIGAIFANTMPALLWRWGHIDSGSHFLLIGALALYLASLKKPAWRGLAAAWIGWLVLVYLTNMYLFAMVGTVWLCTLIQRRLNGLATTRQVLGAGALTVTIVVVVIALGGQFGAGGGLPFGLYGVFSMNLLSPFVPQKSGFFPQLGGAIDATGGQYEGYNYLGLGLLLASLLVLPIEAGWLKQNLRRHVALLVAFVALTALAVSHRVFAGQWLLFELPMPLLVNRVLGIFRSSGRFFWLIGYAQVAIVVVLAFRRAQPLLILCLAGAAILQLFDVQPLREQIIASIATGPRAEELDRDQVARLAARASLIEVVPSFLCSVSVKQARADMDLMLATARANVPTNNVYPGRESYGLTWLDVLRQPFRAEEMRQARAVAYCKQEIERAQPGGPPGEVFVLLSDQPRQQEMAPDITCSSLSWARYCERSKEGSTR